MKCKYILSACLLMGLAGLGSTLDSRADEAAKAESAAPQMPVITVTVEKVGTLKATPPKRVIGSIEAINEVTLKARVSGALLKINFKEGDMVQQGDLLFEIEDVTYRAKVESARAAVEQIIPQLKYAISNYNRQKALLESEAGTVADLEDAERTLLSVRAQLSAAKAVLMDAENELSYTKIYAPFTGRIGESRYSLGQFVNLTSMDLATIVQMDPIYIKFPLGERDYLNIFGSMAKVKQEANLDIMLANRKPYNGARKVAFVDNKIDNQTNTLAVWGEFENKDMQLIPGGMAVISLSEKTQQAYPSIPTTALLLDSEGPYVYTLVEKDNNGKKIYIPIRRNVVIGKSVNDKQLITEGLKDGEFVVSDGMHKIIPGVPVTPVFSAETR